MTPSLTELHEALTRLLGPADSPAPVAGAEPSSPSPVPCRITDAKAKGYHLDAAVKPNQAVAAARLLNAHGFAMDTITGVDWLAAGEMEVVYDFFHPQTDLHVVLRTRVPRDYPEVPTISTVFPGANWHERETHEFFGIRFLGHPNLTPLLLPEDATYHPLRKDFAGAA
jgi:NADH:ubiquinone oxidoreductase subunit C